GDERSRFRHSARERSMTDQNDIPTTEAADDALQAAVDDEARVEELITEVAGDDAGADAIEALADAEDIDADGVLVQEPVQDDAVLDELAEDEAILDEDDLFDAQEPPAPKPVSPYDRPGKWYVLHTQSGYENKVRQNIEDRKSVV